MEANEPEVDAHPEESNDHDKPSSEHKQRAATPYQQSTGDDAVSFRGTGGHRTRPLTRASGSEAEESRLGGAHSGLHRVAETHEYEESRGPRDEEAAGEAEAEAAAGQYRDEGRDHYDDAVGNREDFDYQGPLTQSIKSEPRITHTGSKYLNESLAVDYGLQQSTAAFEMEVLSIVKLFDYQNNGNVKTGDIGEILRCLNFNPTEAEVTEFIKEAALDGDMVAIDAVLPKVAELMESGKYQQAAEEELLAAFCTLDPSLSGHVSIQQLRDALTMFGEPLTDEEFDDLVKFAPIDPKSGKVNYKEYAKELCMMK